MRVELAVILWRALVCRRNPAKTAGDQVSAGEGGGDLGQRGEMIRLPLVVGIDEGDPLACGVSDPAIARHAGAGIGLADQSYRPANQVINRRDAAVGGGVVDDDDFGDGIGLVQHRFEHVAHERRLVEQRDDDAGGELAHRVPRFVVADLRNREVTSS